MTDIVQRLQNVGNIAFEDINDAIAEITRLRADAASWKDTACKQADECNDLLHEIERLRAASKWHDMDDAPKGGGAEMVTDPAWVEPPLIYLMFAGGVISVARWEHYYADGGRGYTDGVAWVEPCSSELLHLHYGMPLKWQPLPSPPTQEAK